MPGLQRNIEAKVSDATQKVATTAKESVDEVKATAQDRAEEVKAAANDAKNKAADELDLTEHHDHDQHNDQRPG